MISRIYLLVFLLFIAVNSAFSLEKGVIKGRIVDVDNLSLPGATVIIQSLKITSITDNSGNFTMVNIPEGDHNLSVSYIGYLPELIPVKVLPNKTASVDIKLTPGLEELSEVVVTGYAQGQSKALNAQMNKSNITNIISSDQVGRFPDANIGDALKRIPGINVQYDQGEARFGNIRGTAPQYNSVMINGERVPSAEAENRTVQLDLVSADMIQSIEVNKAVTPDMDADAIGGAVNLVTRSAPYNRRLSLTVGSGYNILSEKPMLNGSLIYGNRFLKNRLGVIVSLSYFNHRLGSDNIEAEWNYSDEADKDASAYFEEFQIRQYYIQRIRQSYSLAFDYKINENHTIYLNGIYNWRNDWENRYRTAYKDIEYDEDNGLSAGEMVKETKGGVKDNKYARLEDQRMMSFSLSGDHQFGKVKVDWLASYNKASEERPNERYISYKAEDLTFVPDLTDTKKPRILSVSPTSSADFSSDYELDDLTEEFQYTEDLDKSFRLNILIPVLQGKYKNSLKTGARYKSKDKMRDNILYKYSPNDEDSFNASTINNLEDFSKSNFLAGDYLTGNQVKNKYLGGLNLSNEDLFEGEQDLEAQAGNFDAHEGIWGGYIMLNQNFGDKLFVIAGLRAEHTSQEYQGYQYYSDEDILTQTAKGSESYLNVLPGFHLKYNFNKNTILRAAWTNTIARPNYYDLVPYREITLEDNEIALGNPDITPTASSNIDLMVERYFKTIGVVSAGLFVKRINDFIVTETKEDYLFEGNTWDKYSRPINGGNALLFGIECAFQRQLDFLPGFWSGFGVYANYTYTTSSVDDFRIEGREDDDISLPGTAENTFNFSLSYDNKKFSIRSSVNYSSAFVDEFGEESFFDRYYDKAVHLDVNASYIINKRMRVYAEALNLLNQPLYYYQGSSSRLMQAEYYNSRFQIGLKFDL